MCFLTEQSLAVQYATETAGIFILIIVLLLNLIFLCSSHASIGFFDCFRVFLQPERKDFRYAPGYIKNVSYLGLFQMTISLFVNTNWVQYPVYNITVTSTVSYFKCILSKAIIYNQFCRHFIVIFHFYEGHSAELESRWISVRGGLMPSRTVSEEEAVILCSFTRFMS